MINKQNMLKEIIIITVLIFSIEAIMTFPLLLKINTHIPGFFSTDESYAVLWNAWFTKHSVLNNLSIKKTDFIAYPFGADFYTNKPIIYIWFIINYFLAIATNPVLTYNLQVLLNIFFTFLFTYLLVRHLGKNKFSAFFSGIIFGFCPYMFIRAWQHLGDTYQWVMPFVLLGLFLLKDNFSIRTRAFFISGLILATIGFNFYYVGLFIMLYFIYSFCYNLHDKTFFDDKYKAYMRNIIILGVIAFIVLLPQIYVLFKGLWATRQYMPSVQNPYHRPFEDLFPQSARPLSYFLPSIVHPLFGKFTEMFIGSSLYGISSTEHTLYLGWTPLVLAFIAFKEWKRPNRRNFYAGFFLLLAITAWFFSQPPWWKAGPFKIFMPSFVMYRVLPMFRAYCRFGVVVMLAIAVLAGFGLGAILNKFRSQKAKITVTILFCSLVLFEFWNYPPLKVIDVSKVPQVYYWLKGQAQDFVIAEYPLDMVGPSEMYKMYQTIHEKKIINAATPGTYPHKVLQTITKLSKLDTVKALKWMNVKYVIVHKDDYMDTDLMADKDELGRIPQNTGLTFVKNFPAQGCPSENIMCIQKTGPIDVYEVTAQPKEPFIER